MSNASLIMSTSSRRHMGREVVLGGRCHNGGELVPVVVVLAEENDLEQSAKELRRSSTADGLSSTFMLRLWLSPPRMMAEVQVGLERLIVSFVCLEG